MLLESSGVASGSQMFGAGGFSGLTEIELVLPQVAALTLGSTRETIPILGTSCTLYHNLQVFLFPWPVDAAGRAEVVFTPPPIPGLSFKMQAATLNGTTIRATNGLDLVCH